MPKSQEQLRSGKSCASRWHIWESEVLSWPIHYKEVFRMGEGWEKWSCDSFRSLRTRLHCTSKSCVCHPKLFHFGSKAIRMYFGDICDKTKSQYIVMLEEATLTGGSECLTFCNHHILYDGAEIRKIQEKRAKGHDASDDWHMWIRVGKQSFQHGGLNPILAAFRGYAQQVIGFFMAFAAFHVSDRKILWIFFCR